MVDVFLPSRNPRLATRNNQQGAAEVTSFRLLVLGVLFSLSACIPFGDAWVDIEGTVVDAGGRPIAGANVVISAGQGNAAAVTDEQGHYRLKLGVCPCDFPFAVAAVAPGYKLRLVSLPGKGAMHLSKYDIALQRDADPR
jgi:hypothetical protein